MDLENNLRAAIKSAVDQDYVSFKDNFEKIISQKFNTNPDVVNHRAELRKYNDIKIAMRDFTKEEPVEKETEETPEEVEKETEETPEEVEKETEEQTEPNDSENSDKND